MNNTTLPQEDIEKLESAISSKIGKTITLKEIKKVGSGHHSDGFKVITSENELPRPKGTRYH